MNHNLVPQKKKKKTIPPVVFLADVLQLGMGIDSF